MTTPNWMVYRTDGKNMELVDGVIANTDAEALLVARNRNWYKSGYHLEVIPCTNPTAFRTALTAKQLRDAQIEDSRDIFGPWKKTT